MTDLLKAAIVLVAVVGAATIALGVVDQRRLSSIRAERDSLSAVAAATSLRIAAVQQQALLDSAMADSLAAVADTLRTQLAAAQRRRTRVVAQADSIRATIDEDTLTAGLQALVAVERAVAESYRQELDLERGLRETAEADLASCRPLLGSTQSLLAQAVQERDAFHASLDQALRQLEPGFFRRLLRGLPEIGGGAAAGGVVAALNDGDVALGVGIGAAAAIVVKAVF